MRDTTPIKSVKPPWRYARTIACKSLGNIRMDCSGFWSEQFFLSRPMRYLGARNFWWHTADTVWTHVDFPLVVNDLEVQAYDFEAP